MTGQYFEYTIENKVNYKWERASESKCKHLLACIICGERNNGCNGWAYLVAKQVLQV